LTFEKKEHAGWDPLTQTFIMSEIPKEIKTLLKKAGFKKKDLKSKTTALAIFEILLREVEYDAIQASRSLLSMNKANIKIGGMNLSNSKGNMMTHQNDESHLEGIRGSSMGMEEQKTSPFK
jgi:hypothetical protein